MHMQLTAFHQQEPFHLIVGEAKSDLPVQKASILPVPSFELDTLMQKCLY